MRTSAGFRRVLAALGALAAWSAGGCQLVGGAVENYRRESTRAVAAEYEGLKGKSFAVVTIVDRVTQAEFPLVAERITARVTANLVEHAGAASYLPAERVIAYLGDHPGWQARPWSELAKELGGAERLVIIELSEYRLHEPGDAYLWKGIAAGTVSVVEADDASPDTPAFRRAVRVEFPKQEGRTQSDMSGSVVNSELSRRFIERVSWTFYEHQEPYYPEY